MGKWVSGFMGQSFSQSISYRSQSNFFYNQTLKVMSRCSTIIYSIKYFSENNL